MMLSPNLMLMAVVAILVLVLVVFVLVLLILALVSYEENPVQARLTSLRRTGRDMDGLPPPGPFDELRDALFKFAEPISKRLYGDKHQFQKQIKTLLTEAGLPDSDAAVYRFLTVQVATAFVLGALCFPISFLVTQAFLMNVAALIFGLLMGRMLPQVILRQKAKRRQTEIRYTLPDTLDLMVVCVEAGLGMDATIQRVAEDAQPIAPDMAYEFRRLGRELNAGISRMEAFHNLGARSGVEELRSLCALIVQSDKLGTSVGETLRVYAEDMRVRRRQRAEELAAKASIKMTFPLVLFIFPPLFIVLLGPTVIQAIKVFSNGGVGGGGGG